MILSMHTVPNQRICVPLDKFGYKDEDIVVLSDVLDDPCRLPTKDNIVGSVCTSLVHIISTFPVLEACSYQKACK